MRLRPLIERALCRSGNLNTFDEVYWGVHSGHMQLWTHKGSLIVTQISVYPKHKAVRAFLAAGKAGEIMEMIAPIAEWAKREGCSVAEFEGRLGWEKPLSQRGWRKRCVTMQLDLGNTDGV